jgi:hypothetical protein
MNHRCISRSWADGSRREAREWLAKARAIYPAGWRNACGRHESVPFKMTGYRGTEIIVQTTLRTEQISGVRLFSRREAIQVATPPGFRKCGRSPEEGACPK